MLSDRELAQAYVGNRDGVGILAWRAKAWRADRTIADGPGEAVAWIRASLAGAQAWAIHWRYATHGRVNLANCHPFELTSGWIMHNGTLQGRWGDSRWSDTRHACDALQAASVPDALDMLQGVGGGSRFLGVSLRNKRIMRRGEWHAARGGMWASQVYSVPGLILARELPGASDGLRWWLP